MDNETVQNGTPKLRPAPYTTSTTRKLRTEGNYNVSALEFENSLGRLSLNTVDISNITDESKPSLASSLSALQTQRNLASESIQRATNKVGLLPSKYFKWNISESEMHSIPGNSDSSLISDSDLLKSLVNSSTPRNSMAELSENRREPRRSMSDWSKMVSNPNVSIENFMEEFKKQRDGTVEPIEADSAMFLTPEEAAAKLLADEQSWRQRNEVPQVRDTSFISQPDIEIPSTMSLGAYFGQKSDDISNFAVDKSPEKARQPVALVDNSHCTLNENESCTQSEEDLCLPLSNSSLVSNSLSLGGKSLSVSSIDRIISMSDESPGKIAEYLFNQAKSSNKKTSYIPSVSSSQSNFSLKMPSKEVSNSPDSISNNSGSLPVSRNTSYTSNFSENRAIQNIVENKENFNSINVSADINKQNMDSLKGANVSKTKNRSRQAPILRESEGTKSTSSLPSRTSSSLTNLPDGKLPIESTKNELSWDCVKLNKTSTKEFLIRNKTAKTLKLQCHVSGRDFKIRKDNRLDSESLSACKFVLYAHESRQIIVSFSPTKLGSARDELIFSPLDSNLEHTKKQCIRLFGYGGHTNVEYHGPMKDNTGKFWLSLGKLDSNKSLIENSFTVTNSGDLSAFVYVKFTSKRVAFLENLNVNPNFFVLPPNEQKTVTIAINLNSNDCKLLQQWLFNSHTANIGNLEVFSDGEATRGRLRRLCRKSEEKKITIEPFALVLKDKIPGEAIPTDVITIKESHVAMKELLAGFSHDEIGLTLEHDPDQTLIPEFADDSALFQTISMENTRDSNETFVGLDNSSESCKLEPSLVLLNPPGKVDDSIFLISNMSTVQHFECDSIPAGLEVSPSVGSIYPGDTVVIKVKYPRKLDHKSFKIVVYVDNDMLETDVKILLLNNKR